MVTRTGTNKVDGVDGLKMTRCMGKYRTGRKGQGGWGKRSEKDKVDRVV